MPNLLQKIKNYFDGTPPKPEVETEIIQSENPQVSLTPFEEKLNVLYMGCYNVNPLKPGITQELGTVHNQRDCINLGKTKGYQYVALQDGNQCFGTNDILSLQPNAVSRTNCNMVCDESSAGFCGGVFKNQVYSTSLTGAVANEYYQNLVGNVSTAASNPPNSATSGTSSTNSTTSETYSINPSNSSTSGIPSNNQSIIDSGNQTSNNTGNQSSNLSNKESFKHLENFALHNKEMNMIDKNISQIDMLCQEPINKYNLLLSLLIVILLTYIIIEIIYKKTIN